MIEFSTNDVYETVNFLGKVIKLKFVDYYLGSYYFLIDTKLLIEPTMVFNEKSIEKVWKAK